MNDKRLAEAYADQLVVITSTCMAIVEEEWILRVPANVARRAAASDQEALALLQSEFVVGVENVDVRDEHERVVLSVEYCEGSSLTRDLPDSSAAESSSEP